MLPRTHDTVFRVTILFLDFASNKKRFALVDEHNILKSVSVDDHADENLLLPTLQKLIEGKDVTHIACVTGPGGFTSLRVGVALANALSFGMKIPIAGVHLSDLYGATKTEQDFLWLHSTRKTMVFVRGFGSWEKIWSEPTLISLEDLNTKIEKKTIVVGELISEHQEALKENAHFVDSSFDSVLPRILSQLSFANTTLLPWYGREA